MKGKRNTQLNKQEWLTPQAQIQLSTVSRNNTTTPHMKQISTKRQNKRRKYHPDRDSDQDKSDKRHWKLGKAYTMSNTSSTTSSEFIDQCSLNGNNRFGRTQQSKLIGQNLPAAVGQH
jgi:hypothetical protein